MTTEVAPAGLDSDRIRHRHLGTEPGEGLIITVDALSYSRTAGRFLEETGLSAEDVATAVTTVMPIPLFADRSQVRHSTPEAWTNPIMWMPADWRNDLGGWTSNQAALRIMWEVIAAGLYDQDHGWVDVLYLHGIDIDEESDKARVARWITGGADEVLDAIDITDVLVRADNPEWAAEMAESNVAEVTAACYAAIARSIHETAEHSLKDPEIIDEAVLLCQLTAATLRAIETLDGKAYHVYSELAESIATKGQAKEAIESVMRFCSDVLDETDDVLVAFLTGEEPVPDTTAGIPDFDEEEDR